MSPPPSSPMKSEHISEVDDASEGEKTFSSSSTLVTIDESPEELGDVLDTSSAHKDVKAVARMMDVSPTPFSSPVRMDIYRPASAPLSLRALGASRALLDAISDASVQRDAITDAEDNEKASLKRVTFSEDAKEEEEAANKPITILQRSPSGEKENFGNVMDERVDKPTEVTGKPIKSEKEVTSCGSLEFVKLERPANPAANAAKNNRSDRRKLSKRLTLSELSALSMDPDSKKLPSSLPTKPISFFNRIPRSNNTSRYGHRLSALAREYRPTAPSHTLQSANAFPIYNDLLPSQRVPLFIPEHLRQPMHTQLGSDMNMLQTFPTMNHVPPFVPMPPIDQFGNPLLHMPPSPEQFAWQNAPHVPDLFNQQSSLMSLNSQYMPSMAPQMLSLPFEQPCQLMPDLNYYEMGGPAPVAPPAPLLSQTDAYPPLFQPIPHVESPYAQYQPATMPSYPKLPQSPAHAHYVPAWQTSPSVELCQVLCYDSDLALNSLPSADVQIQESSSATTEAPIAHARPSVHTHTVLESNNDGLRDDYGRADSSAISTLVNTSSMEPVLNDSVNNDQSKTFPAASGEPEVGQPPMTIMEITSDNSKKVNDQIDLGNIAQDAWSDTPRNVSTDNGWDSVITSKGLTMSKTAATSPITRMSTKPPARFTNVDQRMSFAEKARLAVLRHVSDAPHSNTSVKPTTKCKSGPHLLPYSGAGSEQEAAREQLPTSGSSTTSLTSMSGWDLPEEASATVSSSSSGWDETEKESKPATSAWEIDGEAKEEEKDNSGFAAWDAEDWSEVKSSSKKKAPVKASLQSADPTRDSPFFVIPPRNPAPWNRSSDRQPRNAWNKAVRTENRQNSSYTHKGRTRDNSQQSEAPVDIEYAIPRSSLNDDWNKVTDVYVPKSFRERTAPESASAKKKVTGWE